jgi:hypothetical protein
LKIKAFSVCRYYTVTAFAHFFTYPPGFSAVAIGNRVGHESQTITFHYAHMFPTEQIEMADKLNEEFVPGTGNGGDIQ